MGGAPVSWAAQHTTMTMCLDSDSKLIIYNLPILYQSGIFTICCKYALQQYLVSEMDGKIISKINRYMYAFLKMICSLKDL